MVQAYSIVHQGAWPGSCWPEYEIDYPAVEAYMQSLDPSVLDRHLSSAPENVGVAHA
jgi:glutaconate CoA-transferase subunit A